MPVYLRKNLVLAPPSISELPEDDADDYLQDPDLLRDTLPQPFRMLDKVLVKLIDDAWEIISSRESKREAEASKIRPPKYECGVQIQENAGASCMSSSPDGKVLVMGLSSGLVVVDAATQQTLAVWTQDNMHITAVQVAKLDDNIYLASTITDMGLAVLFGVAGGMIFQLQILNEQDGSGKMLASKCEASAEVDFVGVYLENAQGKDGVLEIHKVAREAWIKEIEGLVDKAAANKGVAAAPGPIQDTPPTPTPDGDPTTESQGEAPSVVADQKQEEGDQSSQSPGSPQGQTSPRPVSFKFTPTSIVLKVTPPQPPQGVAWTSPLQLAKSIDHGEVIGTGMCHQVSVQHLETRLDMFKQLHRQHWHHLPKEEKHVPVSPTWHFLAGGRMLPQGSEGTIKPDVGGRPTTVAVWWSGHSQMCHYLLIKTAKELEQRPDLVWPHPHAIVATATSPCTSLISVALSNGSVIIWDKHLGMHRGVTQVEASSQIVELSFLDPSVCPQDDLPYPPYATSTNVYVLVWCQGGELFLVNAGLCKDPTPRDVSTKLESSEENYTKVIPVTGIPQLILTCRVNGTMFLHDVLTGHVLCEVTLPKGYQLTSPWEPVVTTAMDGQTLYVRGHLMGETGAEEVLAKESLFAFQLRSFPTLDAYRSQPRPDVPYIVHTTVETRLAGLLTERLSQQEARKNQMQERWTQMKSELELLQQARSVKQSRQEMRSAFNVPTTNRHVLRGID